MSENEKKKKILEFKLGPPEEPKIETKKAWKQAPPPEPKKKKGERDDS